jgi:hypothetical protein
MIAPIVELTWITGPILHAVENLDVRSGRRRRLRKRRRCPAQTKTEVNRLATSRPIDWFEHNLIGIVPLRYAGALRRVYPGFVPASSPR